MSKYSSFKVCLTALLALGTTPALAAPTSGAYVADKTQSYVQDATSQGISLPNMVLCYMNSTGANQTELLNQGNYIALVDTSKCEDRGGSGNSASGNSGSSSAPSYLRAVVNGSRTDNNSPMIGKIWFQEDEMGGPNSPGVIYAKLSATTAASSTSPYGEFRTDFCGTPNGSSACSAFFGYVRGDGAAVSAYQEESGGQSISMTLSGTTSSGSGRIKVGSSNDWKFAYNSSYFHRANNNGTNDTCFNRSFDAADKTAWRYGVYSADGARLERSGGFPIKSGAYYGYVGYWGLWLPGEAPALNDGDSVTSFSYGGSGASQASYTLVKKAGRLKKLTRNATTLGAIEKVPFYYWSNGNNYEIKWNGTYLEITGTVANNGTVTPLTPTQVFDPSTSWSISGWSQSLGGQLTIKTRDSSGVYAAPSSASVVTYLTETVLTPGGTGWPTNIYCVNGCPNSGATFRSGLDNNNYPVDPSTPYASITVANFGGGTTTQSSQWNWNPVPTADVLTYAADATSGLLTTGGISVAWTDSGAPANPQYNQGFSSGRMVGSTGLASLQCDNTGGTGTTHYCPNRMEDVATSYVWETGSNSWNKFTGLKDSTNTYVSFDPPLPMTYAVPGDAAVYGNFAGTNLVLQYNGFGDLHGIPGKCVDPVTNIAATCTNNNATRWVAAFAMPAGTTVTNGGTTYYVKPLEQELRLAKVSDANCTALTLPTILDAALPGASGWTDPTSIGNTPTVTSAPRVIHGVVQY